jgi:hypothetical protein
VPWQRYFDVFDWYTPLELLILLSMSLLRYFVFTMQFYWLLHIFGLTLPFIDGIIIISVIYLSVTAVPTVAFAELGIRGSISIYAIGLYLRATNTVIPDQEFAIFAASTMIWFINLMLPAILGTFFVFRLKFFRR